MKNEAQCKKCGKDMNIYRGEATMSFGGQQQKRDLISLTCDKCNISETYIKWNSS